jgi:tryptophan synthase alpha subunit
MFEVEKVLHSQGLAMLTNLQQQQQQQQHLHHAKNQQHQLPKAAGTGVKSLQDMTHIGVKMLQGVVVFAALSTLWKCDDGDSSTEIRSVAVKFTAAAALQRPHATR